MNLNVCNNCAGNYEYRNGRWKCPYCGAYKPDEISPEEVTLLYHAAQTLRLCNFDEAEAAYSDIIEKFPKNPNGYWGRLLSKYGIKYEDDFDGRKIPTCYATSMKSITEDKDFQSALTFADEENRAFYQSQASYMENVRKEWIEKASRELPYDIFISYKESDAEKKIDRTADSIAVQDLYIHLTDQGYRVFYSRESLRDKTGEKYEPYIFNAISTAKVMLVYGSSAEYIKSTWLKNEWHRFYKRIVSGEKHPESLIVACDGFSPSDLPSILSSRQCLDATRKTFFLDLDKYIKRIVQEDQPVETAPKKQPGESLSALHEHTYKTKIVKPTCIAKGYTLHRCDCGYEYRDAYTPLVDHAFSKWVETKHETCTEAGEQQRKGMRCGETESAPIPAPGHLFEDWIANEDGTHTAFCQRCGSAQTKEISDFSNKKSKAVSKNASLPLSQVVKNHTNYWKSYLTSETTKVQKLQKLCGILFLLSFFFMMIAVSSGLSGEHPIARSSMLLFFAWIIFGCFVLIKSAKAANNRKKQTENTPQKKIRIGHWIASRCFFFCTAIIVLAGLTSSIHGYIIMCVLLLLWGLLFLFFAFIPKAYKKIGLGKRFSVSKKMLVLAASIISVALIILFPNV